MCCGCDTSYIVSVHIQCQASIYTLSLCRGHSWRVRLALVCRGPWMLLLVLQWQCFSSVVFIDYAIPTNKCSYKLRRVKCEVNFVSSGSKIVKRLRCRKYDPLIIERTIGLVIGPSTSLYRSFLKHGTLTNKAVGTIWRDLSKLTQRRQGPDPCPLWLLVGTLLVLGPELASRRAEHSLLWRMPLYIFDILFLSPYMFVQ